MNLSVSPEAERELIDGAVFYAKQSHRELGLAFIGEFERSLEVLRMHPLLGLVWREETRRFSLRRFPYSIIYQVNGETVRVIALALSLLILTFTHFSERIATLGKNVGWNNGVHSTTRTPRRRELFMQISIRWNALRCSTLHGLHGPSNVGALGWCPPFPPPPPW